MKTIISSIVLAFALVGCNKTTDNKEKTIDSSGVFRDQISVADSTLSATKGCYIRVIGNDTLFANIEDNLGTVTGKLYYKNFEKDKTWGEIVGFSDGDTLKVDYLFQSEGKNSSMEIWFLKKDKKIAEGIGKRDQTGLKYANYKDINFDVNEYLEPSNCTELEKKIPTKNIDAAPTPIAEQNNNNTEKPAINKDVKKQMPQQKVVEKNSKKKR